MVNEPPGGGFDTEETEDTERISHRGTETQRISVSLGYLWQFILCVLVPAQ
jgi:hypothetical protein